MGSRVMVTGCVVMPVGGVRLAVGNGALCALGFDEQWERLVSGLRSRFGDLSFRERSVPRSITGALEAYFRGDTGRIDDLPADPGGTAFQREVWAELRRVPAGTTVSYGALARKIGKPGASRAVGTANGANPVSIVIPCHRVIRSDGNIGGYGGGIERKEWLLGHERNGQGARTAKT